MSDERPGQVRRIHLVLTRDRVINRRMLRHFRFEVLHAGAYLVFTVVLVLNGLAAWMLALNIIVFAFLVLVVYRAVHSYRLGYQDGLAAYPIAIAQPGPGDAMYLLENSDEIWKPHPSDVAHSMEIMRLEREANGGLSST